MRLDTRTTGRGHDPVVNQPRRPGPVPATVELGDWRAYAACRGVATLFYQSGAYSQSARGHRVTKAKAVCTRCPVRSQCAAYALALPEPYGIWGGFTERERALLRATDWRTYADRGCTRVDLARLQARLHEIKAEALDHADGGASSVDAIDNTRSTDG